MSALVKQPEVAEQTPFLLRQGLEAAGMSQRRLAKILGLDESYLSRLARGHFRPSWQTAVSIADAMGVSLDLFRTNPPPVRMAPQPEPEPARPRRRRERRK